MRIDPQGGEDQQKVLVNRMLARAELSTWVREGDYAKEQELQIKTTKN